MFKHSLSIFLSFFLFLGTVTFSQSAEAKKGKVSHSKVKKQKSLKKVVKAKHKKTPSLKKKILAKKSKKSYKHRKIASIGKSKKMKRGKSKLPREYGRI